MHLRYSLLVALVLAPLALAEAQTCLGTVAAGSTRGARSFVVAGVADIVENANTFGGRVGFLRNTPGDRDVALHLGVRSFSAGGSSVVSVDYQGSGELYSSEDGTKSACAVLGVDAINVSDADNGFINMYLGPSYGWEIKQGNTMLVPFGLAAANLSSAGESETGEFSVFGEVGIGVRLNGGLTATGSVRRSFQDGAVNVLRILVAYPIGGGPR